MLSGLRKDLNKQTQEDFALEAAVNSASGDDADIKDAFLDDPDMAVLGAENDPEIAKLVGDLPEFDEQEECTEDDLDKIEESFIPETKI
jgi:hypothetical protein